jgi:hypothetical protein
MGTVTVAGKQDYKCWSAKKQQAHKENCKDKEVRTAQHTFNIFTYILSLITHIKKLLHRYRAGGKPYFAHPCPVLTKASTLGNVTL